MQSSFLFVLMQNFSFIYEYYLFVYIYSVLIKNWFGEAPFNYQGKLKKDVKSLQFIILYYQKIGILLYVMYLCNTIIYIEP